jgi:hypothetical protein
VFFVYLTRFMEILQVFQVNKRVRRGPIKIFYANFHEMSQVFAQDHFRELLVLKYLS